MASDVLRTPETLVIYKARRRALGDSLKKVDLTQLPFIREWEFWVLVENEFPYDKIAKKHSLLVAKRHFVHDDEMDILEREEMYAIKKEFAESREYDSLLENLSHNRTVPGQYHLHCLKFHHITPIEELS